MWEVFEKSDCAKQIGMNSPLLIVSNMLCNLLYYRKDTVYSFTECSPKAVQSTACNLQGPMSDEHTCLPIFISHAR